MPYGTFKGMPNYRHSEPYCLLKNLKDLSKEEHNRPIKWAKLALKGAYVGSTLGYLYFIGGPTGHFEISKLEAASGMRRFSFRYWR